MLQKGITGFYSDEGKLLDTDVKQFKRDCYATALSTGEKVISFTKARYPANFHVVELGNGIKILLNAHYPYISFASGYKYGNRVFVDNSVFNNAFNSLGYRVLVTAELTESVTWNRSGSITLQNGGDLTQAEIRQVKYWNPATIGEIIYNYWD